MPKKKTSKSVSRKSSTRPTSHHTDDHSFIIIVGGGFVLILIVLIFLGNHGIGSRTVLSKLTTTPKAVAEKDQTVMISNFVFSPKTITVKRGSAVTWSNSDTVEHSIIADDGTFDTGVLAPGEKGSYTFTKPGTYVYHCGIHPSMTATVVVE